MNGCHCQIQAACGASESPPNPFNDSQAYCQIPASQIPILNLTINCRIIMLFSLLINTKFKLKAKCPTTATRQRSKDLLQLQGRMPKSYYSPDDLYLSHYIIQDQPPKQNGEPYQKPLIHHRKGLEDVNLKYLLRGNGRKSYTCRIQFYFLGYVSIILTIHNF